ncbi:MAG: bifunctional UDP-N-acetylglucosamine diphosphorylase/glucosamine-1-phosphate N-acetyltransferase GlmU [Bacteriovoracaceae bacterium]|nr:bifunctional UDP-N-acetylglucosamine diphosphorylase/glucosamine-1-phosphate N-acetyltransferase GlmU [Bacteriovoracaceae bacterium]
MPTNSATKISKLAVVILAAGKGTRMKLPYSKVMAPLLGKKVIDFVIQAAMNFVKSHAQEFHIGVVVGHQKESIQDYLKNNSLIHFYEQKEQKGTADALKAFTQNTKFEYDHLLILCGDTPLLTENHFFAMWEKMQANPKENLAVLSTFDLSNPTGYGRVISTPSGLQIMEEKDATMEVKKVKRVNAGLYLLKKSLLKKLDEIKNTNLAHEFYLTDLFSQDPKVVEFCFEDAQNFLGINDMNQLNEAESVLKKRKIQNLRREGVYIQDESSTFIDWDVEIGAGSQIAPFTIIKGKTHVGEQVKIGPWNYLENVIIGNGCELHAHNHLVDSKVGENSQLGPYARLRPDCDLGSETKIGNFVELKKTKLGPKSKVPHLSYVGDATIGSKVNIGCGFVTCNYDGKNKHQTIIENNVFVGSDCQVVAPITLGEGSFVAAGSTITQSVGAGDFAVARTRQVNKVGLAKKFLEK